jgi:S-adenosylmethionine:tRNA ribosyltransferase-isomerase
MNPTFMDETITVFDYTLSPERIAVYPIEPRDHCKLLVYRNGHYSSLFFYELPEHLPSGSLLVMNDSRVIPARIPFEKETGAHIEVFCLRPLLPAPNFEDVLASNQPCTWECMVGNLKRWPVGTSLQSHIEYNGQQLELQATLTQVVAETCQVTFHWTPQELAFGEVLAMFGIIPLPPYIKRPAVSDDKINYQTVYAKHDGSVAAPTAGLHFTPHVFHGLYRKSIDQAYVTLHVGAGTFKPVTAPVIGEHEMHAETISVDRHALQSIYNHIGNITVVGTTSMRTLESLYWLAVGLETQENPDDDNMFVSQWVAYEQQALLPTPKAAIHFLIQWLDKHQLNHINASTALMIGPGYDFKLCDALITNFHQPKSTLLLLISAFIGEEWRAVYDYALAQDYRFLSYGDASLLYRKR